MSQVEKQVVEEMIFDHFGKMPDKLLAFFSVKYDGETFSLAEKSTKLTPEGLKLSENSFTGYASAARNILAADTAVEGARPYKTFHKLAELIDSWRDDMPEARIVPIIDPKARGRQSAEVDIEQARTTLRANRERLERIRRNAAAIQDVIDNGPSLSGEENVDDTTEDTAPDVV